MSRKPSISFVGSYYPHFDHLGSATNSLVLLSQLSNLFSEIRVFGNIDSELPTILKKSVKLEKVWENDNLFSIVTMLLKILKSKTDLVFFNVYPLVFGNRGLSNVIGLTIPILVSKFTKSSVFTYMHNFVETQNLGGLGYTPRKTKLKIAQFLEKSLGHFTKLTTTLPSMALEMRDSLDEPVHVLYIPYLEAIFSFAMNYANRNNEYALSDRPFWDISVSPIRSQASGCEAAPCRTPRSQYGLSSSGISCVLSISCPQRIRIQSCFS